MHDHSSRILCIAVLLISTPWINAQLIGDRELLKLVAVANKANREAIRTWKGEGVALQKSSGKFQSTTRYKFRFAFDAATDKYLYFREPIQGNPPDKKENTIPTEGTIRSVDSITRVERVDKGLQLTMHPRRQESRSDLGYDFDPFLCFEVQASNTYEWLMAYYDNKDYSFPLVITREKDRITLEHKQPSGDGLYTFRLDQGGNPIEIMVESVSLGTKETVTRSFEKHGDIWLPRRYVAKNSNVKKGQDYEVTVELNNHVLNQPIPPAEFSPESLGIRKGDRVRDMRTGVEYAYEGFVRLTVTDSLKSYIVIVAAIGTALFAAAVLWYRRVRQRRMGHAAAA